MYIHGGRKHDNTLLDDLWALDLKSLNWTCLTTSAQGCPAALFSHTLTAVNEHTLLLLGGCPEQEAGGALPTGTI